MTVLGNTDNNPVESRDIQTVHGWCRGYPFSNKGGSHPAYPRGFWYGGTKL